MANGKAPYAKPEQHSDFFPGDSGVRYNLNQFADLYHNAGRSAVSPVILSLVTLFQVWEDLSDRAAACAAVDRKRWPYAMHLPAAYAGFDASILVDFRKRLLACDAAARIFEHVLHTMQVLKLFVPRGIQRTDSLALFAKARKLTRLECMVETMRGALRAVLRADKAWAQTHLSAAWDERYAKICRSERLDKDTTAALSVQTGDDGQVLLDLASPSACRRNSARKGKCASAATGSGCSTGWRRRTRRTCASRAMSRRFG